MKSLLAAVLTFAAVTLSASSLKCPADWTCIDCARIALVLDTCDIFAPTGNYSADVAGLVSTDQRTLDRYEDAVVDASANHLISEGDARYLMHRAEQLRDLAGLPRWERSTGAPWRPPEYPRESVHHSARRALSLDTLTDDLTVLAAMRFLGLGSRGAIVRRLAVYETHVVAAVARREVTAAQGWTLMRAGAAFL